MSTLKVDNIQNKAGDGLPSLNGTSPEIKFQIRTLQSNISGTPGSDAVVADIADLRFSNLVIGKAYKVQVHGAFVFNTNPDTLTQAFVVIQHNGSDLTRVRVGLDEVDVTSTDTKRFEKDASVIFIAAASTVTFRGEAFAGSDGSTVITGDGTQLGTFSMIEELPYHSETSDFT